MEPGSGSGFLAQLKPGGLVVHLRYGVGRYLGLCQLEVAGTTGEYLLLEYANSDKLYLPVDELDLLSIYKGVDSDQTRQLDSLGRNQAWQRRKRQLQEQLEDMAAELLMIYAKRRTLPAKPWKIPRSAYEEFAERFPFDLTHDQQAAINDIFQDLQSGTLMDRLICGDVGFGKTEVALRAVFVAFKNHLQVAVLVPTAILGQQHLATFKERLAYLNCRIAFWHTGTSAKQQTLIKQQLASGEIDILIATHKMLQPSVKFARLGLVVIDEEHRFGVKQKEFVAKLGSEVAVLSLSATPIPRTMQLAMAELRKISVIRTPPARRLPVKTFIDAYSPAKIKSVIEAELARGGQVYYLHNRVPTLRYTQKRVQQLVPKANIAIAHGQMPAQQLENTMTAFRDKKIDILVCTTVVESGIDVASANTIIIERADLLGLAQLYQLRGRVGRDKEQGIALLLLPSSDYQLVGKAKQRLQSILNLQDLGSGFNLALQDLEIRGVGEFLGRKQSGLLNGVGFVFFQSLMGRAITLAQQGKSLSLEELEARSKIIDLAVPAFIPDRYLPDSNLRLMLYKSISDCDNLEDLHKLQLRFFEQLGSFPPPLQQLWRLKELNLRAAKLFMRKISTNKQGLVIELADQHEFSWFQLIAYWQTKSWPTNFKANGLVISAKLTALEWLEQLDKWFSSLEKL